MKTVNLLWEGADNGNLYRNGNLVPGPYEGADRHQDSLGKGGGTYVYQVCVGALGGDCSNEATVVF